MAGLSRLATVARNGRLALRRTATTADAVVSRSAVVSRRQLHHHRRHCGLAADEYWRIRRDEDPSSQQRKAEQLFDSPCHDSRTQRSWHQSNKKGCGRRAFSSSTLAAPDDDNKDGSGIVSTTSISSMPRQQSSPPTSDDTSALFNVSKEDEHREETKRRRLSEVRSFTVLTPPSWLQGRKQSICSSRSPVVSVFVPCKNRSFIRC